MKSLKFRFIIALNIFSFIYLFISCTQETTVLPPNYNSTSTTNNTDNNTSNNSTPITDINGSYGSIVSYLESSDGTYLSDDFYKIVIENNTIKFL